MPEPRRDAQPDRPVDARHDLRASHEDRDRIVDLLRVSAGDGRLSIDELDERVGAALTARTYGELEALVADLPATPGAAAGVPARKPKEMVRMDCGSGTMKRDGRWAVPQRMEVKVRSGVVTLDFTQAQLTWPTLQIDAEVHSGALLLLTKPGIVVDADEVSVQSGGTKVQAPWGHDVPATLRIDVSGRVRSGTITARPPRPPRRSFLDWLRRRPRPRQPWELPAGHQPYGLPPGQL
ncbi:MAG: DUF1707 domain-containing protein [Streptosporangiaceae bacterium]